VTLSLWSAGTLDLVPAHGRKRNVAADHADD
jgi:hypothetical protein